MDMDMEEAGESRPTIERELLELGGALRAELVRARRRGATRLLVPPPRPPEVSPAPAPTPGPGPGPGVPSTIPELAAACADLEGLRERVAECRACELCRTRTQTVFADGDGSAGVMFVGEAPGADEDAQGVPFVGRAGRLLTDIITKGMRLDRRAVYIANVLKCRPPGNRDPQRSEKDLCTAWLDRQIDLVAPRVIIPLGRHASAHLLRSDDSMGRMRGRVHQIGGRKIVATYHPAFLLRSPDMKKECWKDIQLAMAELDRGVPGPR